MPCTRVCRTAFLALCVTSTPLTAQITTAVAKVRLSGTVLVADKTYKPSIQMKLVGDKLVFINFSPEPPVQIRNKNDGKLVASVGTWGNGEKDFVGPYQIDPVADGSATAWIYDLTRRKLALLDVNRAASDGNNAFLRWLAIRSDATLTAPVSASDGIYSPGFFRTGRLAVFSNDGAFVKFLGKAPEHAGEPAAVTQHAYEARMRSNPDRTMFAVAAQYAGHLDIIRKDGTTIAASVPATFEPAYSMVSREGEPVMLRDTKATVAYVDVETTADRIFALYSGRAKNTMAFWRPGNVIEEYDWSGKLMRVLELPDDATGIAIDQKNKKLYAMHTAPTPHVSVYTLP